MERVSILAVTIGAFVATPTAGQVQFSATPILRSGATIGGVPIAYPQTDSAELVAVRLDIGPGGETGRHMHPCPTFVYVLEGAIDVETDSGKIHSYHAGEAFLMVVNTWTNAKNTGILPAKMLVVYVGERGKPNLVRPH